LLLAVGVWLGTHFLAPPQESSDPGVRAQVPEDNTDAKISDGKKEPAAQGKGGEQSKPATPPKDPDVLTVSQDPKDGGEYRTINEAVAAQVACSCQSCFHRRGVGGERAWGGWAAGFVAGSHASTDAGCRWGKSLGRCRRF